LPPALREAAMKLFKYSLFCGLLISLALAAT
jgi:hypothetical protein